MDSNVHAKADAIAKVGGGAITNPSQYLVLLPPIDGATAASGSYYFPEKPTAQFKVWDSSLTFSYMPSQFLTFLVEYIHRQSSVPYFAGPGGVTPPGGNNGAPQDPIQGWAFTTLRRTRLASCNATPRIQKGPPPAIA